MGAGPGGGEEQAETETQTPPCGSELQLYRLILGTGAQSHPAEGCDAEVIHTPAACPWVPAHLS